MHFSAITLYTKLPLARLKPTVAIIQKAHKLGKYWRRGDCGLSIDTLNEADLLRWWHQYQAQRLTQTADLIRNGILQTLFATRRHLEALECSQVEAGGMSRDRCLVELERIYTQLESLSNRLDSPFLQDSLPLALQHAIQPWKATLDLDVQLPNAWPPEPVEHTRLLIMLVETLLHQLTDSTPSYCSAIKLEHHGDLNQFMCQVSGHNPLSEAFKTQLLASLTPFLNTFQLFTQGEYEYRGQGQQMTWILRWSPSI